MDVDILIREVFIRPTLWNKKQKNHHNRFVLDKLWNEVAQKARTKPNAVRNKWKTLRDKFRSTLASIPNSKSGEVQVSDYDGEWKYFKSLFFLKDQFNNRNSSGDFSNGIYDYASNESTEEEGSIKRKKIPEYCAEHELNSLECHGGSSITSAASSSLPWTSPSGQHCKSSKLSMAGDTLLQVETEVLPSKRAKREEEDDEDLSFFKSLLPHVRILGAFQKMEYRMKILKVTQEFIKTKQTNPSSIEYDSN